jgi:hypothetical protein
MKYLENLLYFFKINKRCQISFLSLLRKYTFVGILLAGLRKNYHKLQYPLAIYFWETLTL